MTTELATISSNLHTQDNRIMHCPLFIVEEQVRIYGLDDEYHEIEGAILVHDGEHIDEEDLAEHGLTRDDCTEVNYVEHWKFVTACFTEAGCEDFIRLDGHNHGPLRIYVASGYRNHEWEAVRDHLMAMTTAPT